MDALFIYNKTVCFKTKFIKTFIIEIIRTLLIILFGLSLIAFTVRAVNFLDLIVENGYNISTYFKYSLLNIFGIAPKFIPLSFLIALLIFIHKHKDNSEFIILWTSGVKNSPSKYLSFYISNRCNFIFTFLYNNHTIRVT